MRELSERELFQLSGLACKFIAEPETIGVFVRWATGMHAKDVPDCDGVDCFFKLATVKEWRDLMAEAMMVYEIALGGTPLGSGD